MTHAAELTADKSVLLPQLGGISHVAFPCISTGLFAFPAALAARIALQTVSDWLSSHPASSISVIFTLFSASDSDHYRDALAEQHPSLSLPDDLIPPPSGRDSALDTAREWVRDADSIIIHAGAGLSADAVNEELGMGLDYTSEELFASLYPGLLRSTSLRTLYGTIGYQFKDVSPQHSTQIIASDH